jgi:hypothetical protein
MCDCSGCSNKKNKNKVSNASMGSLISNKFALLKRTTTVVKGKSRFAYSNNTVTNNNNTARDNRELSAIYKSYKAKDCCDDKEKNVCDC